MDHHECQGEVGLGIDTEPILLALMKSDSICDTGHRCSLPQDVQHLLFEIDGDDLAAVPQDLRHRNRAEAHAAAHVHCGHPRPDAGTNHLFRVVEKSADRVINEIAAPPGANVRHDQSPEVHSILVQFLLGSGKAIHQG